MIRAIIIEDEVNIREGLKKLIKLTAQKVEIVAETAYVKEAVQLIKQEKPDLIFLDIELEDGNGFDLLQQINFKNLKIIFTTAYNQFAIKAFKYSAIDYLVKPIEIDELDTAIKNATSLILNEKEHQYLLGMLNNTIEKEEEKIVLKTIEKRFLVKIKDIIYIEADGAYAHFYTLDAKITSSKNLKYYQDMLDDGVFMRCHHSFLVNLKHIKGIEKNKALKLTNSHLIPVSARKKMEIIAKI